MNLVRYNSNYNDFIPTFNGIFNRFFNDTVIDKKDNPRFVPSVDVIENEKSFDLHVAVPGMKKEDFTLDISENILIISGERKFENEKKEGNYYSFETQYGAFKRTFRIPENVNPEKIEAIYKDGILIVNLSKSEDFEKKHSIKVK